MDGTMGCYIAGRSCEFGKLCTINFTYAHYLCKSIHPANFSMPNTPFSGCLAMVRQSYMFSYIRTVLVTLCKVSITDLDVFSLHNTIGALNSNFKTPLTFPSTVHNSKKLPFSPPPRRPYFFLILYKYKITIED